MLLLCFLSAGCGKGKEGGKETAADTQSEPSGTQEPAGTSGTQETASSGNDSQTAGGETGTPGDGAQTAGGETDAPGEQGFPPFDKSQPWDGKNASVGWYILGDPLAYEISDAYDLYALSLLVEASSLGLYYYYDPNYMILLDTDGDGEVSDEVGYSEDRVISGEVMSGTEIHLKSDIDLNGKTWLPIGSSGSFRGYFCGDGYTISNFVVDGSTAGPKRANVANSYYGLFAALATTGEISDLTVADATFTVDSVEGKNTNVYIGVLSALTTDAVKVRNCNICNVKVEIKKLGDNHTYFGYALGSVSNSGAVVENIKAFQLTVEESGGEPDVPTANEWIGLDSTQSVQPIDCQTVTADPRK